MAGKNDTKVWIGGKIYGRDDAKISVFDHGLLYGDGLFEGIRVYNGKIFLEKEHFDRLYDGSHYLNIEIPMSRQKLIQATNDTIKAAKCKEGYIRLLVTRGVGDLGLDPRKCPKASVIVIVSGITLYPAEVYRDGMSIITSAVQATASEAVNRRVKTMNYMNSIMAKMEAIRAGVPEALMINQNGFVAECTGDNIFIIKNGVLKTPAPTASILEGCTRNLVMKLAREAGITVIEPDLQRYDIYTADECFLTGTAAEIMPVTHVDGRKIGTGKPGKITNDLLKHFRNFIAAY